MARIGMLVDTTLCTGCRGCQVACKQWWDLPGEPTANRGSYENPGDLSPTTWTRVRFVEAEVAGRLEWFQLAWGCLHCTQAPCVDVCPTTALEHNALGFVSLESARCNGCGYCALACPFDVPRVERDALTGRGTATKCNLCQDRVTQGLVPACAKACPTGAIRFGDREAMVALGARRVASLREHGYPAASLYGPGVLGGLGRMLILALPAGTYGIPARPAYPVAVRLWQHAVQPLGRVALLASLLAAALNALVGWRLRRARRGTPEDGP
jgi:formate dehydrogenase iron-sulfur subunit